MEIRASITYGAREYLSLLRFVWFRGVPYKAALGLGTFVLFISVLGCIYGAASGQKAVTGVFLVFLYLDFMLWGIPQYYCGRIFKKHSAEFISLKNDYVFRENELEIKTSSPRYNGVSSIKYEDIFKICETDEYIYIFVEKGKGHIVLKSTLKDSEIKRIMAIK